MVTAYKALIWVYNLQQVYNLQLTNTRFTALREIVLSLIY